MLWARLELAAPGQQPATLPKRLYGKLVFFNHSQEMVYSVDQRFPKCVTWKTVPPDVTRCSVKNRETK